MPDQEFASYMQTAIELAEKGRFKTCPNPTVGAVLVKDGQIVARGWHKKAGGPHAEVECLAHAREQGIDPAGALLVVTLEPCAHEGKTPPCVKAIIEARIGHVVYGLRDPNPEAAGGAEILAEAGVLVTGGVLEQECRDLIADFIVWQTTQRPYVILKLASTLDGRIATRNGHSRWISNPTSRTFTHHLRAGIGLAGGAILIGGGTFRTDNPLLTARMDDLSSQFQSLACVLTSRLPKAGADFQLLKERPEQTVFFASPAATASTSAEALRKIGCKVLSVGPGLRGGPDFAGMFRILREELGCPYVLCEGGGKLALSLLDSQYIDEFHMHLAPIILGDNDAKPLFTGRVPLSLDEALRMRFCKASIHDGDSHLLLRPAL